MTSSSKRTIAKTKATFAVVCDGLYAIGETATGLRLTSARVPTWTMGRAAARALAKKYEGRGVRVVRETVYVMKVGRYYVARAGRLAARQSSAVRFSDFHKEFSSLRERMTWESAWYSIGNRCPCRVVRLVPKVKP